MTQHRVVTVRATGYVMDDAVAELNKVLVEESRTGWRLHSMQPIIFNSASTGYLLLFLTKEGSG